MKIVVCLKAVPETDTRIRIAADGRSVDLADVKFTMSPYDEYALEQGLLLKEAKGGEVIVLGVGGDEVPPVLRDGLARGAESAVHISSDGVASGDPLAVGKVLAAAIKEISPDIVLCGKHGVGGDNHQVHAVIAERLGWAQITIVTELTVTDNKVTGEREIEGGREIVEASLPAVIGAHKGKVEPRYPKLPDIMKAKKKPFETKTVAQLGLSAAEVGPESATVVVTAMHLPPPRQAGRRIEGDAAAQVSTLLDALQNEAKVL